MVYLRTELSNSNKNIRLFGLNLNSDQKRKLYSKLLPVSDFLEAHPENSLNILKDGELYLIEALIYRNQEYRRAQSLDFSLNKATEKIIPKIRDLITEDHCLTYEVG